MRHRGRRLGLQCRLLLRAFLLGAAWQAAVQAQHVNADDSLMAQNGIQLRGWQEGGSATATAASSGNGTTANSPCSWSFVEECDGQGRIANLAITAQALWNLSACARRGEQWQPDAPDCLLRMDVTLEALSAPLGRLPALSRLSLSGLWLRGRLPLEWVERGGLLRRLRLLDLSSNDLEGKTLYSWAHKAWEASDGGSTWDGSSSSAHNPVRASAAAAASGGRGDPTQGKPPGPGTDGGDGSGPGGDEDGFGSGGWRLPLEGLQLARNRLGGALPPWLPFVFPNLQLLDLGFNELIGPLPQQWVAPGNWPNLAVMDMSANPLRGQLPSLLRPDDYTADVQGPTTPGGPAWPRPPPLVSLRLSRAQLMGTLPLDWALLGALRDLRLDNNFLTGTVPHNWGAPGALAQDVRKRNLWRSGVQVWLQGNALSGPVACCNTRIVVRPGNELVCGPRVLPFVFSQLACQAGAKEEEIWEALPAHQAPGQQVPGQRGKYCSLTETILPVCGSTLNPTGARSGISPGVVTVFALAGVALAVAAAAGAVWTHRRLQRTTAAAQLQMRQVRWGSGSSGGGGGGGRFISPLDIGDGYGDGYTSNEERDAEERAALLVGNTSAALERGSSGRGSRGCAPAAAAAAAEAEPPASWQLRTTSLRLQASDFKIALDRRGRPLLLGAGASSRVYCSELFGSLPVAVKVLKPQAARQLTPAASLAADSSSGSGSTGSSWGHQASLQEAAWRAVELEQQEQRLWREAGLLRRCVSPYVVQLLGVYATTLPAQQRQQGGHQPAQQLPAQRTLMLVTELLEGGSLAARLTAPQLRWYHSGGRVALDIARGLASLHCLNVAHLDVKPEDMLLLLTGVGLDDNGSSGSSSGSSNGSAGSTAAKLVDGSTGGTIAGAAAAKLADVGLARMLGQDSLASGACGTPVYSAPEQLSNGPLGLPADLYGLGWVLHGIASGERLARRGEGRPLLAPQDCPEAVVRLVQRCLQPDPRHRPTAAEAVLTLEASLLERQQ